MSMSVSAEDIITRDAIRQQVEDTLAEADIYDARIDQYSNKWGEDIYRIDAAGYAVEVAFSGDLDEFTVELDEKLRNLIMSAAPEKKVGDHEVIISKDERGLVARCHHCGVTISMDQDRYRNMTPEQQQLAKKWAIGFFARS